MLKKTIAAIESEIAALEEIVVHLMDGYWVWFQAQCKTVWAAKANGEDVEAGRLAPLIERKQSGETKKVYLRWKLFGGDNLRKHLNKSISTGIAPSATADHSKQIKLKGTWEVPRALELEKKLVPIRLAMEGLHEARVRLKAAERKLNRVSKENED
jgi:hypothetical protein